MPKSFIPTYQVEWSIQRSQLLTNWNKCNEVWPQWSEYVSRMFLQSWSTMVTQQIKLIKIKCALNLDLGHVGCLLFQDLNTLLESARVLIFWTKTAGSWAVGEGEIREAGWDHERKMENMCEMATLVIWHHLNTYSSDGCCNPTSILDSQFWPTVQVWMHVPDTTNTFQHLVLRKRTPPAAPILQARHLPNIQHQHCQHLCTFGAAKRKEWPWWPCV